MSTSNLITGGAGFIGSNVAYRLLEEGERVILVDNFSRPNVERNVDWLRQCFGSRCELLVGDVRDEQLLREAVAEVDHVFHFAAQVAVTTSLSWPLVDFDVNARGTLCVLEAMRARKRPPSMFFTSTNKVYGALPRLPLELTARGYEPADLDVRALGVAEDTPLDFHSPYGCSKGCADQYVIDYARSYGLPCVVFRMSCIYGPRQFGTEDQGWVAHFLMRALKGEPITIYGDGQQTRDLLFVGDLVEAFLAARAKIDTCAGQAFNIGGGPDNATSLVELVEDIGRHARTKPRLSYADWRRADQRWFVSDTKAFRQATGWAPRTPKADGVSRLFEWLGRQPENRPREAAPAAAAAT